MPINHCQSLVVSLPDLRRQKIYVLYVISKMFMKILNGGEIKDILVRSSKINSNQRLRTNFICSFMYVMLPISPKTFQLSV